MSGDIGQLNRFFVVPHTHWDREWYSPFEHFHLRLAEVVDGVIDVLERDPDFTAFTLDGQAIVL
jgi:alpha-mannosidase